MEGFFVTLWLVSTRKSENKERATSREVSQAIETQEMSATSPLSHLSSPSNPQQSYSERARLPHFPALSFNIIVAQRLLSLHSRLQLCAFSSLHDLPLTGKQGV